MSRCDAGCPEHTCCHELWDRIAELESHNLEYALHEQKLQDAITRIDADCSGKHWTLTYKLRAAIKAAVELINEGRSNGKV